MTAADKGAVQPSCCGGKTFIQLVHLHVYRLVLPTQPAAAGVVEGSELPQELLIGERGLLLIHQPGLKLKLFNSYSLILGDFRKERKCH